MTSTAEIVMVPLRDIDRNPFRLLEQFPFSGRKIRALLASVADVGLWEGVIGRRKGNKVEIAFGHYRIEAARQFGLTDSDHYVISRTCRCCNSWVVRTWRTTTPIS